MNKVLYLTVLVSALLVGCGKSYLDVNENYEGYWRGSDNSAYYELSISPGTSTYAKYEGITTVTATGKCKVSSKKLHIGLKGFKIESEPTLNTATNQWEMKLGGVTYYGR